jgi:hypothetical protein
LLIVLLAVLGVTIIRIGQLLWLHIFLGLLLLGPVALKMASTGYRFVRYYTRDEIYHEKGPPAPVLRGLAPFVVLFTVIVFASGVALLILGPSSRGTLVLIHKVSFIAWIAVTALHVLGHLPEILRLLRLSGRSRAEVMALRATRPRGSAVPVQPPGGRPVPGGGGRWLAIGSALVIGLIIALALLPEYSAWTGTVATLHHHFH